MGYFLKKGIGPGLVKWGIVFCFLFSPHELRGEKEESNSPFLRVNRDRFVPLIRVSAQPREGFVPLEVQFMGQVRGVSGRRIVSYRWSFGDGAYSDQPAPVHIYQQAADYFVQLAVTDERGMTSVSPLLKIVVKSIVSDINKKRLIEFQRKQLRFAYQGHFRLGDLYRSAPYVSGEIDIAGTGFALAGLCIAAEHGLISREKAREFALATITRCLELQYSPRTSFAGFLYHFYLWDQAEGKFSHKDDVEISTIDTVLLLAGMITAGEYFGGVIHSRVEEFYSNINWRKFFDSSRRQFHMAWKNKKFFGYWDYYTDEVLLISLFAIGAPNPEFRIFPEDAFSGFRVNLGRYNLGDEYVYSWWGSLFTYLYAHIFFDFKKLGPDKFYGVDWWENSRRAVEADINFCRDEGYPEYVWGLSACWSRTKPNWDEMEYRYMVGGGLSGEGLRFENKKNNVWPIAVHAAISTLPFFDLENDFKNNPAFWSWDFMQKNIYNHEGFIIESLDANSLDEEGRPRPNSSYTVGMDILTSALMLENAFTGLIWEYFMRNEHIRNSCQQVF